MNGKASQKNTFRKCIGIVPVWHNVCCLFSFKINPRLSFFAGFVDTPLLPGSFKVAIGIPQKG